MIVKNKFLSFGVLVFCVFLASEVLAYAGPTSTSGFSGSTNRWQSYQPTFSQLYSGEIGTYWPAMSAQVSDQCNSTSADFVIGIPPGGCTPTVVRSDLLEDQNVPVFCQLYAIKINPLIKVSSIKSVSFKGEYPEGVSRVTFHPARAAVNSYTNLLGDPMINNIGYVVIILKQNRVEKDMPDWVSGNLTATIRYDAEEAFGTGKSQYYLPVLSSQNWSTEYNRYSFWNGMGYVRVTDVGGDGATIQILRDPDNVVRTLRLNEGETSGIIYLPGYYCRAGLRVKLEDVVSPENSVLLNINGDELWVREGSRILDTQCRVGKISIDEEKTNTTNVSISCSGSGRVDLSISKRNDGVKNANIVEVSLEGNYSLSHETTIELLNEYPRELKESGIETYGEEVLMQQIETAGKLKQFETQLDLLQEFIDTYPSSKYLETVRQKKISLENYDMGRAYASVYVANKFNSISLVDFKSEKETGGNVDLIIGSKTHNSLKEKDVVKFGSGNIEIIEIKPTEVKISYYEMKEDKKVNSKNHLIKDGGVSVSVGEGYEVSIRSINMIAQAQVLLLPEVKHTETQADFTFKLGIEKRAIELSPEKTEQMIKNLDNSIKEWENVIDKLGNVIKAWKGACFATSAILTVKNMVSGVSGEATARSKVMQKYREICDNDPQYSSRTECYNDKASQINAEISSMTSALNSVNSIMDSAMAGNVEKGSIVNESLYRDKLRTQLGDWKTNVVVDGSDIEIKANDLQTTEQLQAALLAKQLGNSGISGEFANSELQTKLRNLAYSVKLDRERKELSEDVGVNAEYMISYTASNTETFQWAGQTEGGIPVQDMAINGKPYRLNLSDTKTGSLPVDKVLVKKNDQWVEAESNDPNLKLARSFVFLKSGTTGYCSNKWPEGTARVSYYETGKSAKLPAIVPFDLKQGYYVRAPMDAYTDAGDIRYFEICNIGSNKIMENAAGDDLCQSFDVNTAVATSVRFTPCTSLNSQQVMELYSRAREAIRQASRQYGQSSIRIFDELMARGDPASLGGSECQDFMSVEDCKTLFNVCDPVICPPSRCNFGGKIPVSDVVQTGVIGSLVLCLPNAKEGVMIPICVSGVHAGLEGYLSIMKSRRDCLKASLESGENIGICDEISSIYTCEFFWRQLSPLMEVIVPKLIGSVYGSGGQQVRGGGEYMMVQDAWNNMQKSIDYMQNNYAQNAFRAFNIRSTEEVGSTFCKAFIGTSAPNSANFLDSLLEPESPHQFYAQFSEIPFSEATIPATSQYKVYFHIFSGNDQGVQYKIYLKSPPDSTYYRSNPTITVKTGYIARGDSADETVDFTAPEGYKELCVVVNAQEECGFKQVTTDFGVNYLAKKYVEEQVEQTDIKTTEECLSGTPSALSLANLNVQEGVSEMVNPEIAMRGIIRVCASENPGQGVTSQTYVLCNDDSSCSAGFTCMDSGDNSGYCASEESGLAFRQVVSSRWKDVGKCDGNMRCWLDVSSVEGDLRVISAVENKSIRILEEQMGLIENGELTQEGVSKNLAIVRERMKRFSVSELNNSASGVVNDSLYKLDQIIGSYNYERAMIGSGTNQNRAEALSLKSAIYRKIVDILYRADSVVMPVEPRVGEGAESGGFDVDEAEAENDNFKDIEKFSFEFQDGLWASNRFYSYNQSLNLWYLMWGSSRANVTGVNINAHNDMNQRIISGMKSGNFYDGLESFYNEVKANNNGARALTATKVFYEGKKFKEYNSENIPETFNDFLRDLEITPRVNEVSERVSEVEKEDEEEGVLWSVDEQNNLLYEEEDTGYFFVGSDEKGYTIYSDSYGNVGSIISGGVVSILSNFDGNEILGNSVNLNDLENYLYRGKEFGFVKKNKEVVSTTSDSSAKDSVIDSVIDSSAAPFSAIHLAVSNSDVSAVKSYINLGGDVNVAAGSSKITPLHLAVFPKGDLEIIKALVGAGANVNAQDNFGRTSLHFAAIKGDLSVITYLMEAGANKDIPTYLMSGSEKPVDYAREDDKTEVVRYLEDLDNLKGGGVQVVKTSDRYYIYDGKKTAYYFRKVESTDYNYSFILEKEDLSGLIAQYGFSESGGIFEKIVKRNNAEFNSMAHNLFRKGDFDVFYSPKEDRINFYKE